MKSQKALIEYLRYSGALKTLAIIRACEAVDRRDFVLPELRERAYENFPLPLGHEVTISQPYTVAYMLELLSPQAGSTVLDVGSGSGWTTALLGHIVGNHGRVIGVELVPELVVFGRNNLARYGMKYAEIIQANPDALGYPNHAPYDRILVSAALSSIPHELLSQLAVGGIMVLPVQHSLVKVTKNSEMEYTTEEHPGFIFVPLR